MVDKPISMSYDRAIIHGVPFFRNAVDGKLYAWTADGTEQGDVVGDLYLGVGDAKADTLTLAKDWRERAEPRLAAWRNAQQPRSRAKLRVGSGTATGAAKPTAAAARTTAAKPDSSESDTDDC